MAAHDHSQHKPSIWPLAVLGGAGAIIASPYVLPLIGAGTSQTAQEIISIFHSHNAASTGSGLAGLINNGLGEIPAGIGNMLAAGGWGTIASSSIIGIGGVLLANWMEKRENPNNFHWSKVIRYSAIATSMLISLPAILTGISIGITFLSSFFISNSAPFNALTAGLASTLGSANMAVSAASSGGALTAMLPHLISCGAGILPVSLAYFMGKKQPLPKIQAETISLQTPQKPLHHLAHSL